MKFVNDHTSFCHRQTFFRVFQRKSIKLSGIVSAEKSRMRSEQLSASFGHHSDIEKLKKHFMRADKCPTLREKRERAKRLKRI
jgi:hypothetical protein